MYRETTMKIDVIKNVHGYRSNTEPTLERPYKESFSIYCNTEKEYLLLTNCLCLWSAVLELWSD